MTAYRPKHLSVSSVNLFATCPAQWKARYVDKLATPTNPPMLFGKAVHAALEAEHRGQDSERALIAAWNAGDADLAASGQAMHPGKAHALDLLNTYRERGYGGAMGEPERKFLLRMPSQIVPVPILGFIDLPIPERRRFREFKTTATSTWTETKIALEYQLHVYGWAYQQLYKHRAECAEYVIFGTVQPTLNVYAVAPSPAGFRLFERAAEAMWLAIVEQRFDGCMKCELCRPPVAQAGPTFDWETPA